MSDQHFFSKFLQFLGSPSASNSCVMDMDLNFPYQPSRVGGWPISIPTQQGFVAPPMAHSISSIQPSLGTQARAASADLVEKPDWLPEDWLFNCKARASGATKSRVDKYYISPAGRKFRSKTEVVNFINTGDKRKRTLDENPQSGSVSEPAAAGGAGSSQKKEKKSNRGGGRKKQKQNGKDFSNLAFDFKNPPQAATWVPKDESNNEWTPVVGNVVVPEAEQGQWSDAQERVTELEKGDGAAAV